MQVVRVHDFSITRDLLAPEPQRLVKQLSAIINFIKFREDRVSFLQQLNGETEELVETQHRLEAENEQLEAQLAQLKAARAAVRRDAAV
jgi:kinetochore protein Nuf2